jgi:hypothetical protein
MSTWRSFLQLTFLVPVILFLLHVLASLVVNLWRGFALLVFLHLDYDFILLLKRMSVGIKESLNLLPLLLHDLLHFRLLELLQRRLKGLFPISFLAELLLKGLSYAFCNHPAGVRDQGNAR